MTADDFPSASDGDLSNGEVIRVAEDDDDQVKEINYTFVLSDHTPGKEVSARHFAVGLTENATLHRIYLYSEDFGYSNCEPDNTAAFGIDRKDNDPGTSTDVSLLTSFKSYTSEEDFIDIKYYKEEKLAGSPIGGSVYDQIVAAQNGCYDNPSEPGWYRINGTITGSSNGDTTTDYKIRDLSNWIYICDCSSRAEAEQTLGPPPGEGDDGGSGNSDGSDGGPTPTATSTAAPTATEAPSAGSDGATATPTAATSPTDTVTATGTATATTTGTAAREGATDGGGNADASTDTATAAATGGSSSDGSSAAGSNPATATAAPAQQGSAADSDGLATPTVGAGPGFGAVTALLGGLFAILSVGRDLR